MRKRRHIVRDNHDRWLISYADFITLLFAFFVVMFASTQTDKTRAKAVSEAVQNALKNGTVTPKLAAILGGTVGEKGNGNAMRRGPGGTLPVVKKNESNSPPPPAPQTQSQQPQSQLQQSQSQQAGELTQSMRILQSQLSHEVENHSVNLRLEQRGLIIGLNQAAFFPLGGDTIDPGAYPIIAKLATVLNGLPNALRLEGHTDSLPINTARFQSNWELSAARSIAMLRLLNERFGVARDRMAIVGYADTAGKESNDTEEGRSKNRRVDIVILSDYGMRAEPKSNTQAVPEKKD